MTVTSDTRVSHALHLPRRRFLTGLAGIIAVGCAPAIVRASSLMPVKVVRVPAIEAYTWDAMQRVFRKLSEGAIKQCLIEGEAFYVATVHPSVLVSIDMLDPMRNRVI